MLSYSTSELKKISISSSSKVNVMSESLNEHMTRFFQTMLSIYNCAVIFDLRVYLLQLCHNLTLRLQSHNFPVWNLALISSKSSPFDLLLRKLESWFFVNLILENLCSIFALLTGMVNKSSTSVNMSFQLQHRGKLKTICQVFIHLQLFPKTLWSIEEAHATGLKHQQMKLLLQRNVEVFIKILYMCICEFKITHSFTIVAHFFVFPYFDIQNLYNRFENLIAFDFLRELVFNRRSNSI